MGFSFRICYADDVTLQAPTGMALNAMLDTLGYEPADLTVHPPPPQNDRG